MNSPSENFRRGDGSHSVSKYHDCGVIVPLNNFLLQANAPAMYSSDTVGRNPKTRRSDRVRENFSKVSDSSLINVFEMNSDRVRSKVHNVFREDLTTFQKQILRLPVAQVSSIDLHLPEIQETQVPKDLEFEKKPEKINYFGDSLDPIITPSGQYIYSARIYTSKQRQKMYEKMEKSRRPLQDSCSGRLKRFFKKKTDFPENFASQSISNLPKATCEIVDFEFVNELICIKLSNGRSLGLASFLNFYSVNSKELAALVSKAKNLCFRGVSDHLILTALRLDLVRIKSDQQALCVDSDSLRLALDQKKSEALLESELTNFFRAPSDNNSKIVCDQFSSLLSSVSLQTVVDPNKAYLNYIQQFLSASIKNIGLSHNKRSIFSRPNVFSRGWRAMRGGGSLLKEFSYWMREYATNPTDTACINMYNFYLQKFMDQIRKLVSSSKENPERVLVTYCRQVLSYLKK